MELHRREKQAKKKGTFMVVIIDALSQLNEDEFVMLDGMKKTQPLPSYVST